MPREVAGSRSASFRKEASASTYFPWESWAMAAWKRTSPELPTGEGCCPFKIPQCRLQRMATSAKRERYRMSTAKAIRLPNPCSPARWERGSLQHPPAPFYCATTHREEPDRQSYGVTEAWQPQPARSSNTPSNQPKPMAAATRRGGTIGRSKRGGRPIHHSSVARIRVQFRHIEPIGYSLWAFQWRPLRRVGRLRDIATLPIGINVLIFKSQYLQELSPMTTLH